MKIENQSKPDSSYFLWCHLYFFVFQTDILKHDCLLLSFHYNLLCCIRPVDVFSQTLEWDVYTGCMSFLFICISLRVINCSTSTIEVLVQLPWTRKKSMEFLDLFCDGCCSWFCSRTFRSFLALFLTCINSIVIPLPLHSFDCRFWCKRWRPSVNNILRWPKMTGVRKSYKKSLKE